MLCNPGSRFGCRDGFTFKLSLVWGELATDARVNACFSAQPCDKLATCPQQKYTLLADSCRMTGVLEGGVLGLGLGWKGGSLESQCWRKSTTTVGRCSAGRGDPSVLRWDSSDWHSVLVFLSEPARSGRFPENFQLPLASLEVMIQGLFRGCAISSSDMKPIPFLHTNSLHSVSSLKVGISQDQTTQEACDNIPKGAPPSPQLWPSQSSLWFHEAQVHRFSSVDGVSLSSRATFGCVFSLAVWTQCA